ncbi:hypothetical protein KKE60_05730 [Patescibacteria group bacterium]|nr:hypothetical protein [Patescibacteria group bacterium]
MKKKRIVAVTAAVLLAAAVWAQTTAPADMTPRQALAVLDLASAAYAGTRADHVQIQTAVRTLARLVAAHEEYEAAHAPAEETIEEIEK